MTTFATAPLARMKQPGQLAAPLCLALLKLCLGLRTCETCNPSQNEDEATDVGAAWLFTSYREKIHLRWASGLELAWA